jgi:hypothetical protein
MTENICQNCKEKFTGRRNQLYCSSRCKSDTNNQRVAQRDKEIIDVEKKMRKNRRILAMLHGLYHDKPLPMFVIKNTEYDANATTGFNNEGAYMSYEYGIKKINDNEFIIIKE